MRCPVQHLVLIGLKSKGTCCQMVLSDDFVSCAHKLHYNQYSILLVSHYDNISEEQY